MFDNTYILIPVYNEEIKIKDVVNSLKSHFSNILLINDASEDNTQRIIDELNVESITHPINLGQGGAIKTGIEFLLNDLSSKYVITFDADGQHSTEDAIKLAELLNADTYDLILGSRFLDQDFEVEIPFIKRYLLKSAVRLISFLTKLDITDVHNGLKGYKLDSLKKIKFMSDKYSFENEIYFEIKRNNFNFTEFPTKVIYSDYSKSKGQSVFNSLVILEDLLYLIFKR